ncbi:MAG TPA: hypothetical protein VFN71_01255 [Methylomirabilota bacterium]|nr:hypothetical protein [Methylomirabilota bacterium]
MTRSRIAAFVMALILAASCLPAWAGSDDAIIPLERYSTPKGKTLAQTYAGQLIDFARRIYHCIPWVGANPQSIGFQRPRFATSDDRYLSVWLSIDQKEDPQFASLPQARRASAMFSRYGVEMLKRMAALGVAPDPNVRGFSIVLSWMKPGTVGQPGVTPMQETLAFFTDKATAHQFLEQSLPPSEFVQRANLILFDGDKEMGRVPIEVWEDNFVTTYKLPNYEPEPGAKCS